MLWIDSVPSLMYHAANVRIRPAAKNPVLMARGTPKLSVRLSVINVPAMLIRMTTSQ